VPISGAERLTAQTARPQVRRRVTVRGLVQGVGFRPFVHRLAHELGVEGWVRNDGSGVEIAVQGARGPVEALVERLVGEAPPLARIASLEVRDEQPEPESSGFVIVASEPSRIRTGVGPDAAVCEACLAELFDPRDRRYRHPFIGCTHCGPRYTLVERLPWDRPNTTMAGFPLCAACRHEYEDPSDRRFHAQQVACPRCGPRVALLDSNGVQDDRDDPFAQAVACLLAGGIVAVKGQGGFHLCCDARNAAAVARLRSRKAREEKPFAVMVAGVPSARALVHVSPSEAELLRAQERPIVLLRKRDECDGMLAGVAPGLGWLGVMLPCTPVQHLLLHEAVGRPAGTDWLQRVQAPVFVTTSANLGGEPTLCGNEEAMDRLVGIADAFLLHDCAIASRCDDSVVRCVPGGTPRFLRRARGYTPRAIALGGDGPAVLALGADLKNAVCATRDREAFVSQHVGDLEAPAARAALEDVVVRLPALLEIEPAVVACDLHPDFHSTRVAERLARSFGVPLVRVQHHHAHVAAVVAEHAWRGPVVGLALDGVGFGADGGVWGGELLWVDGAAMERLGHLAPLRLPGGDHAAREPWRMAASALHALGRADEIGVRFPGDAGDAIAWMLAGGVRSPWTSSCGRWFDAAAGLLGVRERCSFEGQAAMLLEGLAERAGDAAPIAGGYAIDARGCLDLFPLIAHVAAAQEPVQAAARFHATLAAGLAQWAGRAAAGAGIGCVALGGGCFANRLLAQGVRTALERQGLVVLEAEAVPPGDGGLSLGQAWVARLAEPSY